MIDIMVDWIASQLLDHCRISGDAGHADRAIASKASAAARRSPSLMRRAVGPDKRPMNVVESRPRRQTVSLDFRTMAERVNARLKDAFGGRFVRVRGAIKVKCHLMFGVLVLAVDQILRVSAFRVAPT